jgi:hypothetical protein
VLASVIGAFVIGAIFLWGVLIAGPGHGRRRCRRFATAAAVIEAVLSSA